MKSFIMLSGVAIPFGQKNVDTDLIIPARFLKTVSRVGLGKGAFAPLREDPANIFDSERYRGAPILIAGDNFGCGSSREHAPWALADLGLRVVIAPSFADIFSGNAFKNGMLLVALPQEQVDRLMEVAQDHEITIDLENLVHPSQADDDSALLRHRTPGETGARTPRHDRQPRFSGQDDYVGNLASGRRQGNCARRRRLDRAVDTTVVLIDEEISRPSEDPVLPDDVLQLFDKSFTVHGGSYHRVMSACLNQLEICQLYWFSGLVSRDSLGLYPRFKTGRNQDGCRNST